ncbi:GNAT family N-acetyltransferase ['Paenibacillus yunnanensis' Narsing Rao et al. 2020]|uniref:GNAT family N-acetyltransferase n=1 Tax=Paenibacillus tengchongensis TaxID=2608684 RepID=UPI00124ED996|nr:GNAT family N-acetyltransferase [Paenibacillus tengchongensis]
MELEFITIHEWDEQLWKQTEALYHESFPHGAKPARILRRMLDRRLATMHFGRIDGNIVAMAVTGIVDADGGKRLLIDYLAVSQQQRGHRLGTSFLEAIITWAKQEHQVNAVIIEVESGTTETDKERVHFWQKNGFILTPYVHQYIWVPEPYQAMLRPLEPGVKVTDNGQSLFSQITAFHNQSFRPSS